MKHQPERTFLIVFLSCTLSVVFFIGAFNYLIDPFGYFKAPPLVGLNEKKLPGNSQERFDRVVKIISKKPQALMLGSSRVRAGFPESYFAHIVGYPAYKAAFSGARFDEIFSYFEHALHNQPDLKAVFIGLDFFAFSKNLTPISEYSEERMRRSSLSMNDLFKLLLSQATLNFSYMTYNHNRDPKKFEVIDRIHVKVDENDYIDLGTPMIETPEQFLKAEKKMIFDDYVIDSKKVEMFRKLVQTCQKNNIDLKVAFCPAHANYWETIYQCGRWKDFEDLKRELSAIYPIFDFSGFSEFNTELLSKDAYGTYFFELSHFTPHYGKIILDKAYGIEDRCPQGGFLLTQDTVEKHLKTLREQREVWIKNHPDQVIWLQTNLEIKQDM